ncbi:MAG: hypothetical protein AAF989_17540, partial [Planctomycetota bacterium]
DHIWNPSHCQKRGLPQSWVDALADAHESGFENDDQTIYVDPSQLKSCDEEPSVVDRRDYVDRSEMESLARGHTPTNQFHGVHDLRLAIEIGKQLGVEVSAVTRAAITRRQIVRAIQDAIEEDG